MSAKSLRGVRIVFVLPSIGLGGAERQAFFLARHLLEQEDARPHLLSLSTRLSLSERCDRAGIPYSCFELHHGYKSRMGQAKDALRFVARLRRQQAQIVLPYCMFQNVLCGLTWRPAGARLCIWNQRDEGRSRLDPWVERIAVRLTPRFISNSTHGAAFLTEQLRIASARVRVVHNGIELPSTARSTVDWREELGLPPNAFVAAMVANLHSKKDHETLVSAWRHVVDALAPTGRSPQLLLAGGFSDRHQALVAQVASLALQDHVRFLGQVQQVDDLLRATDIAAFSSFTEGVPNAVLEAMAHGLAVVGTDYAGIREAVGPEGLILLAPPRDPAALADRLLKAASDTKLRERIGSLGRVRVAECFGVDKMASEMTAIIASAWQNDPN